MPVPASRITRDPFDETSTQVVSAGATGFGPRRRHRAAASPDLTRTAGTYPCSQKMTMIPWNSSSGPNSGNAVVAILPSDAVQAR